MPSYRIEISPNRRAGCKNKDCKDEKIKIQKGEIRFGTWVEISNAQFETQSWAWKHWGCVTPAQIANLAKAIEGDLELFDGYDDLPEEAQEKVQRAIKQGHVDDEDWKGDVDYNRPGMKGMHARTPKKKVENTEEDEKNNASDGSPIKASKKRGRKANKGDDEEPTIPVPKKSKAVKKEADISEDEEPAPAPKKSKKIAPASTYVPENDTTRDPKKPKKKAAKVKSEDTEDEQPALKLRARGKAAKASDQSTQSNTASDAKTDKASKKKKGRASKVEVKEEDTDLAEPEEVDDEVEAPPKKRKRGRLTKKVEVKDEDTDVAEPDEVDHDEVEAPSKKSKKAKTTKKAAADVADDGEVGAAVPTKSKKSRGKKKA